MSTRRAGTGRTNGAWGTLGLLICGLASGCGGLGEEDPSGAEAALDLSQCESTATNTSLSTSALRASSSPTTYTNSSCPNFWVFETATTVIANEDLVFSWSDRRPRTEAECVGGKLNLRIYAFNDSGVVQDVAFPTASLQWSSANQVCYYPFFRISSDSSYTYIDNVIDTPQGAALRTRQTVLPLIRGWKVKVAAQALTPRGSTQSVGGLFRQLAFPSVDP